MEENLRKLNNILNVKILTLFTYSYIKCTLIHTNTSLSYATLFFFLFFIQFYTFLVDWFYTHKKKGKFIEGKSAWKIIFTLTKFSKYIIFYVAFSWALIHFSWFKYNLLYKHWVSLGLSTKKKERTIKRENTKDFYFDDDDDDNDNGIQSKIQ